MSTIKSPIKAIKAKCLDCSADNITEVKECPVETCSLFPFRFGKNPFTKREISPEQREAMAERLRQARLAKNNENKE